MNACVEVRVMRRTLRKVTLKSFVTTRVFATKQALVRLYAPQKCDENKSRTGKFAQTLTPKSHDEGAFYFTVFREKIGISCAGELEIMKYIHI